jgi:hypothetical protein
MNTGRSTERPDEHIARCPNTVATLLPTVLCHVRVE